MKNSSHFVIKFLWHVALALWACALALFALEFLGTSSTLSRLVGGGVISFVVEGGFFALSGGFALLLWYVLPYPQKIFWVILAYLPPILIFLFFLA